MKVLDTSVAIDHLRGYAASTAVLEEVVSAGEALVASELTRFELLAGARRAEHDDLEVFFATLDWVPVTEEVCRLAGEYASTFRGSHQGVGAVDYLIAATASAVDGELLTMNVQHFPMFDDLAAPYRYPEKQ